jgi:hypothetical protein
LCILFVYIHKTVKYYVFIYTVKLRYLKYINNGLNKELKCSSLLIKLFFFATVLNIPHVC